MDGDLAAAVVPYMAAAVGAYGAAVLDQVRDEATDVAVEATVGAGRRLLRRLLRVEVSAGPVQAAVRDLVEDPTDEDRVSALRVQVRKALAADPRLAAEVAAVLSEMAMITAAGVRSVAAPHNSGIVQTGDASSAWQERR